MKKAEYDQKFATYAQRCTDMQGSASQISGIASGASRKSTASSKARRLERIKIERLKAEMEARLQSEKRKIELEMEMSIKLADLAAREALLDVEETESLLERKSEPKPCVVSHKIVATRSAQPITAKNPPVSKKTMVVNTSNWESRVSFPLPQYPTASTIQAVPGPSWQSDVEPRLTQPCTPQVPIVFTTSNTRPLKSLPTTVTSGNARYGVSFYDSPDDRLSFTPVVPTSVHTPRPLRETPLNPNLTDTVTNLRDVLYQGFTLPKITLRTFDGNPLDYYGFIKSFSATIREQVTEPASQLEYLIDMCTGKARESIKHLSIVTPPSLGMKQAMETLTIGLVRSILSLRPTLIQSLTVLR